MAKYEVAFKVVCSVYLEVEAEDEDDAEEIADEMMTEIDIGERAENFGWEFKRVTELVPLLDTVYGGEE